MRHRTVAIEAGDGAETGTDESGPARARRGDLLIDHQFGDGLRRQRLLQPRKEFAQGGAVLLHRGAHMVGLGVALARFGEAGRIDRFDHLERGRNRLPQPERDAARIDQQRRAGCGVPQCRQRGSRLMIAGQLHAIGGQRVAQCGRHLAVRHEQRGALGTDQRMRKKNRVVTDVGAAQIEQVSDIVQRRNEMPVGAEVSHRAAQCGQLGAARHARVRRDMFVDGCGRQAGAFGPHLIEQIEIGAQADAARIERLLQHPCRRQSQHRAVDCNGAPGADVIGQPFDMRGAADRRDFDQRDAGTGQLGFGLRPVAAVGPDPGEVGADDQGPDRAGKAGKPFTALPARRQVFRQMRIGRRYHAGVDAMALHGLAQGLNAGPNGGFGCVQNIHGVSMSWFAQLRNTGNDTGAAAAARGAVRRARDHPFSAGRNNSSCASSDSDTRALRASIASASGWCRC